MSVRSRIKKYIPSIILGGLRQRRYYKRIYNYNKARKKISCKEPDLIHGPRVIFVLQFPEVWNSLRTIYEAAKEQGIYAKVLCIPKIDEVSKENYNNRVNEALQYCIKNNIDYIDAVKNRGWIELESYQPDYVFYARPYNSQYPAEYRSDVVCKFAKICYVPYAFDLIEGLLGYVIYDPDFLIDTYISFAPSLISLNKFKDIYCLQNYLKINKYVFLGFPRFDLCIDTNKINQAKTRLLWLPRWTADSDTNNRKSHFLQYVYEFIDFMYNNSNYELTIRPHPLMIGHLIESGMISEEEMNGIIKRIEQSSNISFDKEKDYFVELKRNDIIISDFSSLLIECLVADKPVIYCDTADEFNEDAKLMDSAMYHANSWNEIRKTIWEINSGNDYLSELRKQVINQIVPNNSGDIGKQILNYVCDDYKGINEL